MKNAEYEAGMAEAQGDADIMLGVCVQRIEFLERQLAETHACLKEAMEWCKPCNYEHEPWLRWAKARDSYKPNTL